jgi:hypothetical protein
MQLLEYRKFTRPFPLAACVHPVPCHLAALPPAPTLPYCAAICPSDSPQQLVSWGVLVIW